jgi:putative nucleotidyltransferase with HDIG domain
MKAATDPELIDVHALRIGMFVHLDGGWMSHPFPLSNFKIASAEQIATIRSLGLKQVRWNPRQSDAALATEPPEDAKPGLRVEAPVDGGDAVPIESPEARARAEHKCKLADQRAALVLCERQFAEAGRAWKHTTGLVSAKPQQARRQAEALSKTLVSKMLGEQDLCIQLLTDSAGDKAATHALNVTIISLLMGRGFGLGESDMLDLGVGALLHDIGKADLPERMRHRAEHFTPSEAKCYEEHVAHGLGHARKMGLTEGATLVLAQHHEHADGSGFPLKLVSDRMSAAARIVSLVNRYDNLCNPAMAAQAVTPHDALALLFALSKTKSDTAVLGAFIKMMGVYPAGSTVQLTDDRYAMVVAVNASRPLRPRVLVHDAAVPREEALVLDLEGVEGLGVRRSIKPMHLPPPALHYLSPRPRVAYFFEPAREAEAVQ